jgi:uncharacterized protein
MTSTFVGREEEIDQIRRITSSGKSSLLVVYGRRRIGKTTLIEHCFSSRNLIKFEGVEDQDQDYQRQKALKVIQKMQKIKTRIFDKVQIHTWGDIFEILADQVSKGVWTLYFEEVQWLASYETQFFAELKVAWDNFFSKNPKLIVIICGSAPSFIHDQLVSNKALYNRAQMEIHLHEFSLREARMLLRPARSWSEVLEAHLAVGGVPFYLQRLDEDASSVFLNLCQHSFKPNSLFSTEANKIFVSRFAKNPYFKKIVNYLAMNKHATRSQILAHLKIRSGGKITEVIEDLENCGFISSYHPFFKKASTRLTRYHIQDQYLQFYYQFIAPHLSEINNGDFSSSPVQGLSMSRYEQWLGYSFERWCRKNHRKIAAALGFNGVEYQSGTFFNQASEKAKSGFQIDLLFQRRDRVLTICEIKYQKAPVQSRVVGEVEEKIALLQSTLPHFAHWSIQRVLIAPYGAAEKLKNEIHYFDRILMLEDLIRHL